MYITTNYSLYVKCRRLDVSIVTDSAALHSCCNRVTNTHALTMAGLGDDQSSAVIVAVISVGGSARIIIDG